MKEKIKEMAQFVGLCVLVPVGVLLMIVIVVATMWGAAMIVGILAITLRAILVALNIEGLITLGIVAMLVFAAWFYWNDSSI